MILSGLERELGDQTHDGTIRGRQHHLLSAIGRLQSGSRVHRRLHILVDALQGRQPDAQRRVVPQTHRWMDVKH